MASLSSTGPGAYHVRPGTIEINGDRTVDERRELTVTNTADRPIQVGSHLHLADVNDGLDLDRTQAQGFRLDIAAGTSVRFEPGASKRVAIVALRGRRLVPGIQRRDPGLQNPSGTEKPEDPEQPGAEHPDDPEKKDI